MKPANLVLTQRRSQDWVKIHVLGLAGDQGTPPPRDKTGPLARRGGFSAPERIAGERSDKRTDVYGLGAILFFMLTGKSLREVGGHMVGLSPSSPPLSVGKTNPKLANNEGLERLIQRCLAFDAGDRFPTMSAISHALDAIVFSAGEALSTLDSGGESLVASVSQTFESSDDSAVFAEFPVPEQTGGCVSLSRTGYADTADLSGDQGALLIQQALADVGWGQDDGEESLVQAPAIDLEKLNAVNLDEYVAYIDLNCPFCYAHHERFVGWGLAGRIRWRLVEHASHIIDGPFDSAQETILAQEVLSLHRRAPDVNVVLPPRRFSSMRATRLLVYVQREHPNAREGLLTAVYRVLWRDGRDIDDESVLLELLEANELPFDLLERCCDAPAEMAVWQKDWESADYDTCIPVTTHVPSGRVLIGLPTERVLMEFLFDARPRILDNAVCFYRPRPSILVCGALHPLWPLLSELRMWSDIIPASSINEVETCLSASARPDMVIIHSDLISTEARDVFIAACVEADVPWLWATLTPNEADESAALSAGAAEYLPVVDDAATARARLRRLIVDRLIRLPTGPDVQIDPMTHLVNRRGFIEYLAAEWERSRISRRPLSLLLINLDQFKAFNAAEGALMADERLKGVAKAIERCVESPSRFLARIGGDTFALLLPDASAGHAEDIAERLRIVVRAQRFEETEVSNPPLLTASIGVATRRVLSGLAPEVLVEAAEEACWAAKENGRDQVAVR